MAETDDTTRSQTDGDPDTSATILIGVVGAILVFVVIVGLQALFYNVEQTETVSKIYSVDHANLSRLRNEQLEQLYGPVRWIDESRGIVGIPIDLAMDLVVRESVSENVADLEKPGGES